MRYNQDQFQLTSLIALQVQKHLKERTDKGEEWAVLPFLAIRFTFAPTVELSVVLR